MALQILNPLEIPEWDSLVLATGKASIFHSSAWARVVSEAYGYKPLYFSSFENGGLAVMVPFMEVKSWLTGTRGVSLPFTDKCEAIVHDKAGIAAVKEGIIAYGSKAGWKHAEWRDGTAFLNGETVFTEFYGHVLNLTGELEDIFAGLRPSTRRNIKKALRGGLHVEVVRSSAAVKDFYRLHCVTRKSHGYPPQPYGFFEKIGEHILSDGKGFVVLARIANTPVAGAVFFHFGDTVLFKYGASDERYHPLRPNNLVMWEAIRWSQIHAFKRFDFGRTNLGHRGLLQFKSGWGAKARKFAYYKYDLRKKAFVKEGKSWALATRVAGKLPSALFNQIGHLLYRHVG